MHIQKIHLAQYRNYSGHTFEFSEDINCIVGQNGSGKTNLLDAIYFLALTKSSLHNNDHLSINHQAERMQIDGLFNTESSQERITLTIQKGQKKVVLTNQQPYEKLADHIGRFPVVLIAPDDTDLIRDGSETRRKLFDGIMAQFDKDYLAAYQQYNRLLERRNSLLKQFAERQYFDQNLLDTYSEPMLSTALQIHQMRFQFLQDFLPLVQHHYAALSEGKESVAIVYDSELGDPNFTQLFKNNEWADRQAQRTQKGVHKDDFLFEFDGFPFKKFGSQGQKKSFIMALRLAQYALLQQTKLQKPILLLDDIFDKLDDNRIQNLIDRMADGSFGQVFITDARPERSQKLLENIKREVRFIPTDQ